MRTIPHNLKPRDLSQGFTLIEVLVIVPIFMLVITGLVVYMINLLNANTLSNLTTQAVYDTHAAFDTVESDAKLSKTFLVNIDPNMSDPYGPDGAGATWDANNITGSGAPNYAQANVLILRMYATTADTHNPNKAPVYINQNGCGAGVINTNPVLTVNVIYFVQNNNLYRRVLADQTNPSLCNTPYQQQTCPSGATNAICHGTDKLLLTNVYYLSLAYTTPFPTTILFPQHGPYRADLPSPLTQSQLTPATSVRFGVSVSQTINGNPSSYSTIYEFTKINS